MNDSPGQTKPVEKLPNYFSDEHSLKLIALSVANESRCPHYGHGALFSPEGWLPTDWCVALVGEFGELCNLLKKLRLGDFVIGERHAEVAFEIADVVIYLDLLSQRMRAPLLESVQAMTGVKDDAFSFDSLHTVFEKHEEANDKYALNSLVTSCASHIGLVCNLCDNCEGMQGAKYEREFKGKMMNSTSTVLALMHLIAIRLNVDVGEAVRDKFNVSSERIGVGIEI